MVMWRVRRNSNHATAVGHSNGVLAVSILTNRPVGEVSTYVVFDRNAFLVGNGVLLPAKKLSLVTISPEGVKRAKVASHLLFSFSHT